MLAGGFIPSHPAVYAQQLNEKLATFAPELTPGVFDEFARSYRAESLLLTGGISKKFTQRHAPEPQLREAAPHQVRPAPRPDYERDNMIQWQRTTAIILLTPWISNLPLFYDPSHVLFDQSGETIRVAIRKLIYTVSHDKQVSALHACQESGC
jgi:hypothetical protein